MVKFVVQPFTLMLNILDTLIGPNELQCIFCWIMGIKCHECIKIFVNKVYIKIRILRWFSESKNI